MTCTAPLVPSPSTRIRSIDWVRGACVLLMIHAHALVLLRPQLRTGELYRWVDGLNGLVSPGFILASGFSLTLVQLRAAGAEARRARVRKSLVRVGQVLGVACAVNAMWFSLWIEPWRLFRLDILHAIGAGLLLTLGLVAALRRHPRVLCGVAGGLGLTLFLAAPLFSQVPPPLAHFLNKTTGSLFPLLPWTGYALLGVPLGLAAREGQLPRLRRAFLGLAAAGFSLWALNPWLRFYPPHDYYEFHPSYHGLRLAAVCVVVAGVMAWEQRRVAGAASTGLLRLLEQVSNLALPGYFFHLALLHYPFGGASFVQRWNERSGVPSFLLLTAILIASTYGLAHAFRSALARLPKFSLFGLFSRWSSRAEGAASQ